jgi:2-dehydropantoate 2-reductase
MPTKEWGAGAIGGTIGAYMVRGGVDVLFVDLVQEHVDAINESGLTVRGYEETFTVKAKAVTPDTAPDTLGKVILAVKAPATRGAMEMIAPRLAPDGYVVSAQNGLNELVIRDAVGAERTIGCFINFSADYHGPGLIHFGGPGAFYIGELDGKITPRLRDLRSDLAHWGGGEVRVTDNIWGFLWGKQAYGAILFATALSNDSMADGIDKNREVMVYLAREVLAVADAQGYVLQGFDGFEPEKFRGDDGEELQRSLDGLIAVRRRDQKTHSGVWRDLAIRKRRTEVDAHYPPILELARQYGIQAPILARMVEMIHEIEDGKRPLSEENLVELAELIPASRAAWQEAKHRVSK